MPSQLQHPNDFWDPLFEGPVAGGLSSSPMVGFVPVALEPFSPIEGQPLMSARSGGCKESP